MTNLDDPARSWSGVAAAWDASVDFVDDHSAAATAILLERLHVRSGDRLLELAAGPGAIGEQLSTLVGPTGTVLLSDIAPGMVDVARRRNEGLDNVEVAVIDLTAIDRPDTSFDAVVCRMGLMFAPEPANALAEIGRVLAPGGRLGALTWAGMEHNPWMTCVGMAAAINGLVSGGPQVGPGGIFSLGDPIQLAALAKDAGFVDVTVEELDVTFRSQSIDEHVSRVSSLAGPLASILAAAPPDERAALRKTATDLAAQYVRDDGVAIPGRALLLACER